MWNPLIKEIICTVVIALLSQGIETMREIHQRRHAEAMGYSRRPGGAPDDEWY